ncbi:MAG: hypothetical protein WD066_07080 [Planctomycetaceae bacterium]
MARKTPSRQELRKQVEAAESRGEGATKKKKAATKAKGPAAPRKRKKDKVQQRKRMMWVVYNASMKEEARFPYDQRDEADKKAEALRKKAGKLFFVQPVKENITDGPAGDAAEKSSKSKKAAAKPAAKVKAVEVADEELEDDEDADDAEEDEEEEEEPEEPDEE